MAEEPDATSAVDAVLVAEHTPLGATIPGLIERGAAPIDRSLFRVRTLTVFDRAEVATWGDPCRRTRCDPRRPSSAPWAT